MEQGTRRMTAQVEGAAAAMAAEPEQSALPPVPSDVLRLVEAYVFASPQPVTAAMLRRLLPDRSDPAGVMAALQRHVAVRGVVLIETGGGWAFRTAPDLAGPLGTVLAPVRRLPRASMEVLAAIALHQPATRAEIEAVRGAALSQPVLDALLDAGLVAPAGRKEATGRPTLWATTGRFLEVFGLRSIHDLPGFDTAGFPAVDAQGSAGDKDAP